MLPRRACREVVLVSDEDIGSAQELLWDRLRLRRPSPAAAPRWPPLLSGRFTPGPGESLVAVVISGANTTAVELRRR